MSKAVLGLIGILFAFLAIYYVFDAYSYREPYRTTVYCLESTSKDASDLRKALKEGAFENGLRIVDRSSETASNLDKLDQERPDELLHGAIKREGELILSYSNLPKNGRTFALSFYADDYEAISISFDRQIRGSVTPTRIETFPGGGFNSQICVEEL